MPPGQAKQIQDMIVMNAQNAFAFRRTAEIIHAQRVLPQEFMVRLESRGYRIRRRTVVARTGESSGTMSGASLNTNCGR